MRRVLLCALAMLGACGSERVPSPHAASGLQLECSGSDPFPASVFEQPGRALGHSQPDRIVVDDPTLHDGSSSRYQWRTFEEGDSLRYFGGDPPFVQNVNLQRNGDAWAYRNSGGCDVFVHHAGRVPASWAIDASSRPEPGATEFIAIASDLQCASGAPAEQRVSEASVDERDDAVVVTFNATPVGGNVDCPGHPPATRTVRLERPLGERRLLDGGSYPAQPPCGAVATTIDSARCNVHR